MGGERSMLDRLLVTSYDAAAAASAVLLLERAPGLSWSCKCAVCARSSCLCDGRTGRATW